jgi:hypothetical protein
MAGSRALVFILLTLMAGTALAHNRHHGHRHAHHGKTHHHHLVGPTHGQDMERLTAEVRAEEAHLAQLQASQAAVGELRLAEIALVEKRAALQRLVEANAPGIIDNGFEYLKREYYKAFSDVGTTDTPAVFEGRIRGNMLRLTGIFSNIYPTTPNAPVRNREYRLFVNSDEMDRMRIDAHSRDSWYMLSDHDIRWDYITHTTIDANGELLPMVQLVNAADTHDASRLKQWADQTMTGTRPVTIEGEISHLAPSKYPYQSQGPIDAIVVTRWHIVEYH